MAQVTDSEPDTSAHGGEAPGPEQLAEAVTTLLSHGDPANGEPVRYCVASESCALDIIGADLRRDVRPGEMVCLGERGIRTERTWWRGLKVADRVRR